MKRLFPAIFESIWSRKETAIFLLFAIYPLLYLIGSFFGSSNFMQITIVSGHELSYLSFLGMMLYSVDSFILVILALYFLVLSVFQRELDEKILFLYKDLNKKAIFWSKYLSLLVLVCLFFIIFALISLSVYYGRVIHMDIGANLFLDKTTEETIYSLSALFSLILKMIFSLTVATVAGLYLKKGATILIAIVLAIVMTIASTVGGIFGLFFPNGYVAFVENGSQGIVLSFIGPILLSLFYIFLLTRLGIKRFACQEF